METSVLTVLKLPINVRDIASHLMVENLLSARVALELLIGSA